MALPEPANDVRRARFTEAVAAYQSAVDAGQSPSPRMWAACYPEVAEELKQFFEEQGQVRACAAPLPDRGTVSARCCGISDTGPVGRQ